MEEEEKFSWNGSDVIYAEKLKIKLDYREMNDLLKCSCKYPNFIGGTCVHCGREEREQS